MTYYWRLNSHEKCLKALGIEFGEVIPRMSRDFLIKFETEDDAKVAEKALQAYVAFDEYSIFSVDNRGNSLFIELIYPNNIKEDFTITNGVLSIKNFKQYVSFVAIKNGEHNSTGYLIDTTTSSNKDTVVPLASVFNKIIACFDA